MKLSLPEVWIISSSLVTLSTGFSLSHEAEDYKNAATINSFFRKIGLVTNECYYNQLLIATVIAIVILHLKSRTSLVSGIVTATYRMFIK